VGKIARSEILRDGRCQAAGSRLRLTSCTRTRYDRWTLAVFHPALLPHRRRIHVHSPMGCLPRGIARDRKALILESKTPIPADGRRRDPSEDDWLPPENTELAVPGVAMALWLARIWVLGLALAACREPQRAPARPARTPPSESQIAGAALAAIAAAPWDTDPTGWGTLCTAKAPCDTLVVDPRVVALPAQPPAFFVPDRRDRAATISPYTLSLAPVIGRKTIIGSWRECSARRDAPRWAEARVACVALGVAGLESARPDAMTFALLVATPARRLSWPRVRVTRPRESWRGRLLSNASE